MKRYDGDPKRCPHCGNIAAVEQDSALRFICAICGGPRLPLTDTSITLSGDEVEPLKQARRHRIGGTSLKLVSVLFVALGVVAFLFALLPALLMSLGVVGHLALWLMVASPFIAAYFAFQMGGTQFAAGQLKLQEAWVSGVHDLLAQAGTQHTAKSLAKELGVELPFSEQLLQQVALLDDVSSDISDAGDVVYRVRSAKVRVDAVLDESAPAAESDAAASDAAVTEAEDAGLSAEAAAKAPR